MLRLCWVAVAATMLVLMAVLPEGTDAPFVVLSLVSYPACLLANLFLVVFPVRVEGLPELPLTPVLMAGLGFGQWFLVVPWILRKVPASQRNATVMRSDAAGQTPANVTLLTPMTRRTATSLLVLLVAWRLALFLSFWITVALIPINNRLIYEGDAGVVMMRLWLAVPLAVTAAMAAPVVLTLSDAGRKDVLLAILTALMLYSGFSRVAHEWTTLRETIDRVGIVIQGMTPALACAVVGVYWLRRQKATRTGQVSPKPSAG